MTRKIMFATGLMFMLLNCIAQKNNTKQLALIASADTEKDIIRKAATITPSARQLRWQQLELTAFFHFGVNTFSDREWGTGKEDPAIFNPTKLDANQWVKTVADAGIKQVILTAKHHDGFCLWPTKTTNHSVKSSPWKNGQGDVVKEVAEACRKQGMGFGVYLSPWDMNSPVYGSDAYNDFFVQQLTELLTNYGKVDEVWFDGANGEGPNGKKQVYDFARWYKLIRELQPSANIAIMGPDVRWVGTETGYGRETEWSVVPANNLDQAAVAASSQKGIEFKPTVDLRGGDISSRDKILNAKGMVWYPAETDVSIRPGWFYHSKEDNQVKSPSKLLDIYYSSVGRNGVLLLNIPPDRRGRIHSADSLSLVEFKKQLDATVSENFIRGALVYSSTGTNASILSDGKLQTYWTTRKNDSTASIEISFNGKKTVDLLVLQENIAIGQRIEKFVLEAWNGAQYDSVAGGTTVGYKRTLRFDPVNTNKFRLRILSSRLNPTLAEIGLYKRPDMVPANIIPQPTSIVEKIGSYRINENTGIVLSTTDKELRSVADFLASSISEISGYTLPIDGTKKGISLKIIANPTLETEGYELNVSEGGIEIAANTRAGIFYGIQSLLQTLPAVRTNALLDVPAMTVTDYPRFKWRGMHLDVSRHFFSPETIKEYLDLMARYKMNVFHWHLTDDSGWRIEIKKYPLLTSVGAWRVDRPGKSWGERSPAKSTEHAGYGGYYTQDQIKEIVAYAATRNITIVPEIEMPGHSLAALAAYPALSCTGQPQFVNTGGQYTNDIQGNYCAGNDSSFLFLQDVLDEVLNLFPSQYIHVGGDEVDKTSWKKCPKCQARMKAENLKDENELQSYFIRRMEKYLVAKQRKMIGWDEILEGGLAPEATVMSWRGESGGIAAAKMKHSVIMTPGSPCYFDHYQAGPEGEPLAIGGFNPVSKVYDYEPVPKELQNTEFASYVMGAQGNVWTEFIPTREHLEYMVLPRMLALAEVLWSPAAKRNWRGFSERLQSHFAAFDQRGLHYSPGNYTINIKPGSKNNVLSVALATDMINGDIYYSTDGSQPGATSLKYSKPLVIDSSQTIKAVSVVNGKVMSPRPAEQSFVYHKAIGRDVKYTTAPSKYYPADGPNSLTDGIRGVNAAGKFWHAFNGHDLEASIDLGETKEISSITLGCWQNYGDWIFLPTAVKFEISADGSSYKEVGSLNNEIPVSVQAPTIKDFKAAFAPQPARYIRVKAQPLDACPKGHPGEGKPAWIFADEIMVN